MVSAEETILRTKRSIRALQKFTWTISKDTNAMYSIILYYYVLLCNVFAASTSFQIKIVVHNYKNNEQWQLS